MPTKSSGARDRLQVFRREGRRVGTGRLEIGVGVLPFLDDRHVRRVQFARGLLGRSDVRRRLDDGRANCHVLRETNQRTRLGIGPDRLNGQPVSEHGVMPRLIEATGRQFHARCVRASAVPEFDESAELVDGEDVLHPIGQLGGHVSRIGRERGRRVARFPAASVFLEHLRQIPVIERRVRLDAVREKFIDETVVEIETLRIGLTSALREHARPGDREPIPLHAQALHQLNVFFVPVVVVVGHIAVGVVCDLSRRVRKRVPDRRSPAVLGGGAFNLVRRRCRAPQEALGKRAAGGLFRGLRGGRGGSRRGRLRRAARRRRGRRTEGGGPERLREITSVEDHCVAP